MLPLRDERHKQEDDTTVGSLGSDLPMENSGKLHQRHDLKATPPISHTSSLSELLNFCVEAVGEGSPLTWKSRKLLPRRIRSPRRFLHQRLNRIIEV